jgi:hypothetical protein
VTHWAAILAGASCLVLGYVLIFRGIAWQFQLQSDVNAKLPHGQKFEPLFWWHRMWTEFRRLQTEHLPGDQRLGKMQKYYVAGMIFVLLGLGVIARAVGN